MSKKVIHRQTLVHHPPCIGSWHSREGATVSRLGTALLLSPPVACMGRRPVSNSMDGIANFEPHCGRQSIVSRGPCPVGGSLPGLPSPLQRLPSCLDVGISPRVRPCWGHRPILPVGPLPDRGLAWSSVARIPCFGHVDPGISARHNNSRDRKECNLSWADRRIGFQLAFINGTCWGRLPEAAILHSDEYGA